MDKVYRKCASCGETKPRDKMIKITRSSDTGELIFNPDSKTFGRSVYLCYNQSCIESAIKKNKIAKALKTNTNIDIARLKGLLDGKFKG